MIILKSDSIISYASFHADKSKSLKVNSSRVCVVDSV